MNFEINGKVAIITGGASTLGFEYAKELLRDGLKVKTAIILVIILHVNNFRLLSWLIVMIKREKTF